MSKPVFLPNFLVISLEEQSYHEEMQSHLLRSLVSRTKLVKAKTSNNASSNLSFLNPSTVLITTPHISKAKYRPLQSQITEYAKAGGTVILCGAFSSEINDPNFAKYFSTAWSLPWKMGTYVRTTFSLNPRRHSKLHNTKLSQRYCVKAVHVKDAIPQSHVYVTTPDSRVQSHVFAPVSAHEIGQSPVLFTPIGKGFLGYIGDVNSEDETTDVILAMCDFSVRVSVPPAREVDLTKCKVCAKQPVKKCARCMKASYCSRDCQSSDWKEHKPSCVTTDS
jgi:MYND finger